MTIPAAMMVGAIVTFFVVVFSVVVASDVGVKVQTSAHKGVDRRVGTSRNSAEQADSRILQCRLRTAADAAANQNIDAQSL